jgi:glycosyltransferase involved in cell wall biosynthesis
MPYSGEKPHVLVVLMQHSGGGAEKQSVLVAEALKETFEITVVVAKPVPDDWRKSMEAKGFSIAVLQTSDSFLQRRLRHRRLLELCTTLKPDLVYSRWIKLNLALAKERDRGNLKCGLIIQVANTLSKLLGSHRLNKLLFKKGISSHYPKADLILCNGSLVREDLVQEFGITPDKCCYLPNLLAEDSFSAPVKEVVDLSQNSPLRVVSAGRLIAQKDYSTLIKAAAKVSREIPLKVEIFGGGLLKKQLKKEIKHLHLDDVVALRGNVTDVEKYFPEYDLFVSCSPYEGMSNVMLEAMAAGLPVVVTEVSGSRDVLTNPSQGVIFPPGDVDKLVSILKSLALDRERLIVLSREGRRRAADFTLPKLGEEYQRLFRGVVAVRHSKVG